MATFPTQFSPGVMDYDLCNSIASLSFGHADSGLRENPMQGKAKVGESAGYSFLPYVMN